MIVKLEEAATNLASLVQRAAAGEEVIIAEDDAPKVMLVPVEAATPVKRHPAYGRLAGKLPPMDLEQFRARTDEELIEDGFELCVPDNK